MAKNNYSSAKLTSSKKSKKYYNNNSQQTKIEKQSLGRKDSDQYKYWYDCPTDTIASAVQQVVQYITDHNYEQTDRFMRYARLYGNSEAAGWANLSNVNRAEQSNNRPVFNVIQSAIDTINSKIARDNPAPYFITSGADYFDKLKAEKLTQFVQGIFQDCSLYDIANNYVFRDGCIYGLGILQFILNPLTNKIEAEWVLVDELKVDVYDAQRAPHEPPRSIHRTKMVQKEVLIARFPDKEEEISRITTQYPHYFRSNESVVDMVVFTESWHLPLGDKSGRHVVTFFDEVLLDEETDDDYFPFVFWTWYKKPIGLYGRGITEEILSDQVEINKILLMIQQIQELQACPVIITDVGSQIAEDVLLSNNIARMIPIRSGTMPPQFISPQAGDPQIYSFLDVRIQRAYAKVGISQTSAAGVKQPGVESAIAMRTMVDIESSRFIQVSKNWENFFVACAEMVVKLGKKAYEKDPNFKISYVDRKSKILKEIPWSKVNIPDDTFKIKCDTVSNFPNTAAGRIQTITDFISNNFITRERGMELLNLDPDLQGEINLQTSSLRLCEKQLTLMVEEGLYNHPEKYMNLQLALSVSEATYNQLKVDNCPDDRLELVRQWIKEIVTMLTGQDPDVQLLQQAFAPAQPAGPVAPQAGISPTR